MLILNPSPYMDPLKAQKPQLMQASSTGSKASSGCWPAGAASRPKTRGACLHGGLYTYTYIYIYIEYIYTLYCTCMYAYIYICTYTCVCIEYICKLHIYIFTHICVYVCVFRAWRRVPAWPIEVRICDQSSATPAKAGAKQVHMR